MTRNDLLAIALLSLGPAGQLAHSQELAATLGKQRAAGSRLAWEFRDAIHPSLGAVRSAILKAPVETAVGNAKVFSRASFSCEKAAKRFAIEVTNGTSPEDRSGLRPNTEPRLYCSRPITEWDEKLVQEELLANWDVSKTGDALTHGLRPFPLRECVSIRVVQDVALPQGWAQKSARIELDLHPYSRELDSIFTACDEVSAYATGAPVATAAPAAPAPPVAPIARAAPPAPPVVAAKPAAAPAVSPSKPAPQASATWQQVRTLSSGKTNVRAGATLQSAIVAELHPGSVVLVQRTASEWWRAKSWTGTEFEGYIREDRLVFK
jgi:hypothetical protein